MIVQRDNKYYVAGTNVEIIPMVKTRIFVKRHGKGNSHYDEYRDGYIINYELKPDYYKINVIGLSIVEFKTIAKVQSYLKSESGIMNMLNSMYDNDTEILIREKDIEKKERKLEVLSQMIHWEKGFMSAYKKLSAKKKLKIQKILNIKGIEYENN